MQVKSSLLFLLMTAKLSHSIVNRNCYTTNCRGTSCCSEAHCLQSPLVPYDTSHQCPCMIPHDTITVSEGTSITLECDPGGVCLEQCEWTSPMGTCQYKDATWICDDMSIRFLFQEGTCTIQLVAEEWHGGLWTCRSSPYHNSYTDHLQVVVTPADRRVVGEVWWKDGWRAALLWSSIAVILIIIIAIFVVCLCGLCPWITCCGWKTGEKEPKMRSRSRTPESGQRRASGDSGVQTEDDDQTYQRIDIEEEDSIAQSMADTDNYAVETEPEAFTIEYSTPQHYDGRYGGQTRTARKVTNLDTGALEERIRKASGIATNEHLI